jgi:c-di-GMP-binding flagellar brake protein YcgR
MSPVARRWKRLKLDIRVRLRRWEEAEDAVVVVRSYELSEGGMSVYAPELLDLGSSVLVGFTLPETGSRLSLRAVVKNRRGFRCGLEFSQLTDAERSEIARYLESAVGAER